MFQKLIGDRAFYRRTLLIAIPIIVQNGISNFVSLLDNIMVGQVGTLQMSGVSITNTLMFVFNLCVFGATAGPGIFTAQFYGSGDHDGIRHTFRFKILTCFGLALLGCGIFLFGGRSLIALYLQGDGNAQDISATLNYGVGYLRIMLWGLLPFALANAYSGTLRETGQTVVPMVAGITAVFVNLGLNYVLIFGHFGAPALGVAGAAVATVISRYVELLIVACWTHLHSSSHPFIKGAWRSMHIPLPLLQKITTKGLPLLVNEFLWSSGIAFLNQCYTLRGLDVVAAINITTTLSNLSSVVYLAMGNVVGIIMGQLLGANTREEELRDTNRKLIFLTVVSCIIFGSIMFAFSGLFPRIYNTTDAVRALATSFIRICAALMPFSSYCLAAYFTLRSGGKTGITFLFDSVYTWVLIIPFAYVLSHFTSLPIITVFFLVQFTEIVKVILGFFMVKSNVWLQNIVDVKQ